MKNEAEKIKRVLSTATTAEIVLDTLAEGEDFELTLTRETFVKINNKYFRKIIPMLADLLEKAKKSVDDIKHLVMVGGSPRIPHVSKMISDFFSAAEFDAKLNVDETVAIGASMCSIKD